MPKLFVPQDTTAVAVGAEHVALAFQSAIDTTDSSYSVVRNGSRGAFWLEPMVEVECGDKRAVFGPVTANDASSILACCELGHPDRHALYLGPVDDLDWLKNQTRIMFSRCGVGDPVDIDNYQSMGGFAGLRRALDLSAQVIVDEIKTSGLRGRGGAAFPTGIKWQTVLDAQADQKYIVCNADEGDSGTFADRLIMEADPYQLIEGMTIAGLGVGATKGYIYLRSEYPRAQQILEAAINVALDQGYIGDSVMGSDKRFDLEVRMGAGSYICGEETALLNSLEGRRGVVRAKPPLPAIEGLFGKPTVVNNVLTLTSVTAVLADGGERYANFGVSRSKGTIALQLAGNICRGGLIEVPFGASLRSIIEDWGGGTLSGRPVKAIQVGGPLGAYLSADDLDVTIDYEALSTIGGMLGHGGIVVFDDTADMAKQAHFAMDFCAKESCGKCTPCRIGAVRGREVLDRVCDQTATDDDLVLLLDLCDTMEQASLCAMGGLTPLPVKSAIQRFPEDFSTQSDRFEVTV